MPKRVCLVSALFIGFCVTCHAAPPELKGSDSFILGSCSLALNLRADIQQCGLMTLFYLDKKQIRPV